MSGPDPESLQRWAEGRSLAWKPEDTLPPATERLRLGLGVGERRASYRSTSDRGVSTTTGSRRKKPERETVGVARGMLPGGLDGRLGHHVHLVDQGAGVEDRYLAFTDTIVFAELATRAHPVFHLEGRAAGPGDAKAALTIGGRSADEMASPLDGVVPAPKGDEEAGGFRWTSFPAEPDERIRRIVSGSTRFLDGLPSERVRVEYECGALAVWVRGLALGDQAELDQLCRFASALAAGLDEVAGSSPPVEPGRALPLPEPDARTSWVREGADLVEWDKPPVSVVAAQERYREDVGPQASRTGWKVYGIVAVALFLFGLLAAAASLGLSLAVDEYPMPVAIVVAVASVGLGAIAANRIGLRAGQDALEDRSSASAIPWGIEAFARGYATHSGLAVEDHDELRRRLPAPVDGRPQIAWQGEIAPGIEGHLSTWIDATGSPGPPRFYLLAVTGPTGAPVPAGYESVERDGLRFVWQEVTSVQRAIHRLDQLRATASCAACPAG